MSYINLNQDTALELIGRVMSRLTALKMQVRCSVYYIFVESGIVEMRLVPTDGSSTRMQQLIAAAGDIAIAAGYEQTRVYFGAQAVHVEIPAGKPKLIATSSLQPHLQRGAMVVGKTLSGKPLHVDLSKPETPHVLIAGTSGSGKSATWHSMAITLAQSTPTSEVKMLMYDPIHKAPAWLLPHVSKHLDAPFMNDEDVAIRRLHELCRFIDAEQHLNYELVYFIDEVANLIDLGGDEVRMMLRRIAQKGRNHGLRLVLATQKPTSKVLDSVLLSCLPVRVVMTVVSEVDSRLAGAGKHIGAHKLPGKGAGVLVVGNDAIRFSGALPDQYEAQAPRANGRTSASPFAMQTDTVISMPHTPRIAQAVRAAREVDQALLQAPAKMVNFLQQEAAPSGAVALLEAPSPEGDASKMPLDYTLGERIELLYSWNPDISMGTLQRALKVKGRANGFYVIKAECDKRGIRLQGMSEPNDN